MTSPVGVVRDHFMWDISYSCGQRSQQIISGIFSCPMSQ